MARLFAYADHYWPELTARYYQIDLLAQPVPKFLMLVWVFLREISDPDKWDMFVAELEAPVPGTEQRISQTRDEEEGAAFMDAMNTLRMG